MIFEIKKKKEGGKDKDKEEKKENKQKSEEEKKTKKEKKNVQKRPSIDGNFKFEGLYYDDKEKFGNGKFDQEEIKIVQWNLNNISVALRPKEDGSKNPVREFLEQSKPDIFCVTETHLRYERLNDEPVASFLKDEYTRFFNCFKGTKSRHGTAVYSKIKPISVQYDLGKEIHD